MTKNNPPCVLAIAGTDPTGGAGIQADIKAISATGSYAASVITALVAQNTTGVQSIHSVSPEAIEAQINSVCCDLTLQSVKIGMLHTAQIIETIASAIHIYQLKKVVLDPVMVAKSGSPLLDLDVLQLLKARLLPLVHLVTPNLFEAEKLLGEKISSQNDMLWAAQKMAHQFQTNILLKGGHLEGDNCADVLYMPSVHEKKWYQAPRILTKNTHGTGCTLSSAIASFLGQGRELPEAVLLAKDYLSKALRSGSSWEIGQGQGPVDHFWFKTPY